MPNHAHLIKNSSLVRYTRAAKAIQAEVAKLDTDLRALDRRSDLYDGERRQRVADRRAAAEATVRQHRREMDEALADHRSWTNYSEDAPKADDAARRTYYSQQATAELAGLTNPSDVLAAVKRVAGYGDDERSREYVRAATGRAPAAALAAVGRQVEDKDASAARHWGAAVNEIERQLGWFDHHLANVMQRAGYVAPEVKEGKAPDTGLDTRVLSLWADNLDQRAGAAFVASSEEEAQRPEGLAESFTAHRGLEGWDATDDLSADQPADGTQAPADAPADAQADASDAGANQ